MKTIRTALTFIAILLSGLAAAQTTGDTTGITTSRTTSGVGSVITYRSSYYTYEPTTDITAPELAEVLRILLPALACRNVLGNGCDPTNAIEASPTTVKRHFVFHER